MSDYLLIFIEIEIMTAVIYFFDWLLLSREREKIFGYLAYSLIIGFMVFLAMLILSTSLNFSSLMFYGSVFIMLIVMRRGRLFRLVVGE